MKIINREWDKIAAENGNSIVNALNKDSVLRNATRFALKLGEHTWGGDKKGIFLMITLGKMLILKELEQKDLKTLHNI